MDIVTHDFKIRFAKIENDDTKTIRNFGKAHSEPIRSKNEANFINITGVDPMHGDIYGICATKQHSASWPLPPNEHIAQVCISSIKEIMSALIKLNFMEAWFNNCHSVSMYYILDDSNFTKDEKINGRTKSEHVCAMILDNFNEMNKDQFIFIKNQSRYLIPLLIEISDKENANKFRTILGYELDD